MKTMKSGVALKLAFYGDDFTGSTDALEALAFAGLRTVLLLEPPTPGLMEKFPGVEAIGVAGDSRAMLPEEMDAHLPPVFEALARLGAPIVHYKVCSTFDSAPHIGSIGRAMQIARQYFPAPFIPIVGATPALQRYCLFGHLFARSGTDDRVHRIDRHPIMRAHPVTPMDESDLAIHIGAQADLKIARFPFPWLEGGQAASDAHLASVLRDKPDAVLFDSASAAHLTDVGRLIDAQSRRTPPLFVVGPSGVEYALTQWWQDSRAASEVPASYDTFRPVDRVLAISGSTSRLSAQQIEAAIAAGFADVPVDASMLLDDECWERAAEAIIAAAVGRLKEGRSIIIHSARGPDDPRIGKAISFLEARGRTRQQARHEAGRLLGSRLGQIARAILQEVPLQRLLFSGGDTSSQVTKVLAPDGLVVAARLAKGAPLCRVIADRPWLSNMEVALKGGQIGDVDFFETARSGSR